MEHEQIIRIIIRHLTGTASEEDLEMLKSWTDAADGRRELLDGLLDPVRMTEYMAIRRHISPEIPYREMQKRLGLDAARRKWKIIAGWSIAAMIAVVCTVGAALHFAEGMNEATIAYHQNELRRVEELHPGGSRATLTLANGSQVELKGDEPLEASRLTTPKSRTKATPSRELCLEVPRGGEFLVVLEDSTRVWLNSSSKLIYPEHFAEGSRHVSIEGEAYFEVAHDSARPFYVEVPGSQFVKVYGTEFNIRSYPEDPEVRTTLCKGSISLSQVGGSGGELFLSPGHQAVYDKTTHTARLRTADIERVSGWRNGRFVFEDQSLYQIMLDLSRWYDFDFEFADSEVRETIFMGSIPRYSNFTTAIAILEKSGGLKFEIADNKVIISKKKK